MDMTPSEEMTPQKEELIEEEAENNLKYHNVFLDSVDGEVALFSAVTRARPVGIHRDFHMISILNAIEKQTGEQVSAEEVWNKLERMYDLDALEDLEVTGYESSSSDDESSRNARRSPSPTKNLANHPHFHDEFSLFNLPPELDLDEIMVHRRLRNTPSTPSDTAETPTLTKPRRGRKPKPIVSLPPPLPRTPRTPTPGKVNTAGLVSGDSDSSALTENSEIDIGVEENDIDVKQRRSVMSTPRTTLEEEEDVDIGSPPAANGTTEPEAPPKRKRGRPRKSEAAKRGRKSGK